MLPGIVDVTGITGARVTGSPTSWQTPNGPFNVEHVGATSAGKRALDILVVAAARLASRQCRLRKPASTSSEAWRAGRRRNGPFLVEHVAGRSAAGDLIVFWWSPQHDWQAVNVSAKTGRRIAGAPVSWTTPDGAGGTVEHLARARHQQRAAGVLLDSRARLAGRGRDGEDRARRLGRRDGVAVTNGPMIVEHVGGVSPDGTLTVFWWSPAHDWQALNVSSIAGGLVNGRTVSWLAGGVEHVAAHGSNNELFVYWWTPATNWRLVDVTAITGVADRGSLCGVSTHGNRRQRPSSSPPAASTTRSFASGGGRAATGRRRISRTRRASA